MGFHMINRLHWSEKTTNKELMERMGKQSRKQNTTQCVRESVNRPYPEKRNKQKTQNYMD
jgi:hypothetical protein